MLASARAMRSHPTPGLRADPLRVPEQTPHGGLCWLRWTSALTGLRSDETRRATSTRTRQGSAIRKGDDMAVRSSTTANPFARIRGGLLSNDASRTTSARSPVLAILGSLVAGAALAAALVFTV